MAQYQNFLGLGIAGNFALHLAQAGELEDFKDIITADEAAPKGMFPFYLPGETNAKEILSTYPLSSKYIRLADEKLNIQAEPEVALLCKLGYTDGVLSSITPTHFGAYNDCSIRVEGASKISDKKNWGAESKGLSDTLLEIDTFAEGGVMDRYSICSFLLREEILHAYGEDVELSGYSYFYEQLQEWMLNQINTQKDFGPLEPLQEYIQALKNPTDAIISIGATRYTEYGESTFLRSGDKLFVVVYDHTLYSSEAITQALKTQNYPTKGISILAQEVR
ncbi:MAG: DUF5718 family protein [Sulfurimonas sp.]|nr:DUF5718 family protein [Sulfurimonas sp.]